MKRILGWAFIGLLVCAMAADLLVALAVTAYEKLVYGRVRV